MTAYTQQQINSIVAEAKAEASRVATEYFQDKLKGVDQYACGFAWVNIYGVKGSTKIGKMLTAAGVKKDYQNAFQIWNPANMYVQNVDTLEAGAQAAAAVFKRYGFEAYAGSRLD
jgi:hypothetical protein